MNVAPLREQLLQNDPPSDYGSVNVDRVALRGPGWKARRVPPPPAKTQTKTMPLIEEDDEIPKLVGTFSCKLFWRYAGPGFAMAVAYVDPGKRRL